MSITIHGASDDLIEIEGEIEEEFNWFPSGEEKRYLAFSDGTILSVYYDNDGIWRLNRLFTGLAKFEKVDGSVEFDENDKVHLSDFDFKWVLFGEQSALSRKK